MKANTEYRTEPRPGAFNPSMLIVHDSVTKRWSKAKAMKMIRDGVTQKRKGGKKVRISGPLYPEAIDAKDGELFLVTDGRTNNAGKGDPLVLDAIRNGQYPPPRPTDTPKNRVNGNAHAFAIAFIRLDPKKGPSEAALETLQSRIEHHGLPPIGHKDWTTRKSDPEGFDVISWWLKLLRQVSVDAADSAIDAWLRDFAAEMINIDGQPSSLKYVLEFYREIAKQTELSGALPVEVARKMHLLRS